MTEQTLDQKAEPPIHTVTSSDGTMIAYDRVGQGPPVVIVSGGLNQRVMFETLVDLLTDRFTVINYDRRDRGDSARIDPEKYSLELEIDDLAAVIAETSELPYVIANCTGSIIALFAAARGVPMAKLVIYEPPYGETEEGRPIITPDYLARLKALLAAERYDDAVLLFLKEAVGHSDDFVRRFRSHPAWPMFNGLARTIPYDHEVLGDGPVPTDIMNKVKVPTLVMQGGLSPQWQRNACAIIADCIPGGRLVTIEGASHVMPLAEVADPIIQFFNA